MPPWLSEPLHHRLPVLRWHVLAAAVAALVVGAAVAVAGAGGEQTPDGAAEIVPADALVYVHLDLDRDSEQYENARRMTRRFPSANLVLEAISGQLSRPGGGRIDFEKEIRPWLGAEAALALIPAGRRTAQSAFLLQIADRKRAERFLRGISSRPSRSRHRGVEVRTYGKDFVTAFAGDFLVIGQKRTVEQAIDLEAGRGRPLADSPLAERARDDLPGARVAEVYASRRGVDELLARRDDLVGQVGSLLQAARLEAAALALTVGEGDFGIEIARTLAPPKKGDRPARRPQGFKPELAGRLGEGTFAYLGVSNLDATLDRYLATTMVAIPAFPRAFESFRRGLGREGQVDLQRQLLPLLRGEAALAIAPGRPAPVVTLVVDDVEEKKAKRVLARLQGPVSRAIRPGEGTPAATFQQRKIEGVDAFSVRILPTIDLTYALFDGQLVLTTDPVGIERIRKGRARLDEREAFDRVFEDSPDSVSTVVFLGLDELLGQLERAGLGADPGYALIREDLRRLRALGGTIEDLENETEVKLSLAVR